MIPDIVFAVNRAPVVSWFRVSPVQKYKYMLYLRVPRSHMQDVAEPEELVLVSEARLCCRGGQFVRGRPRQVELCWLVLTFTVGCFAWCWLIVFA